MLDLRRRSLVRRLVLIAGIWTLLVVLIAGVFLTAQFRDAAIRRFDQSLAVLTDDGLQCRYLSVVESGNWLRFSVQPDSLKPAYATGTGHAMLAFLPKPELQAISVPMPRPRPKIDNKVAAKRK